MPNTAPKTLLLNQVTVNEYFKKLFGYSYKKCVDRVNCSHFINNLIAGH